MDLKIEACTGMVVSGGAVMHEALSCPIHPEVEAFYRGVAEGKRIQYELMVAALNNKDERYKTWWHQQQDEPGYLDRFHRHLARHYLEQTTHP